MAVTDDQTGLLSDKLPPGPVELAGSQGQSLGVTIKQRTVFYTPIIEPGLLGRPTCALTVVLSAVCLVLALGDLAI
jgi:hypothetical protein